MDLTSPVFFLFAGLGLALYWALDRPAWRHGVMVGLNISFIAGYFAAPLAAAPLVGFLLLGFAANQAVGRWPSGAALWAALAAIIRNNRVRFMVPHSSANESGAASAKVAIRPRRSR